MKNKYIYILISIVCFFAFSGNVEAAYKEVCQYSQTYSAPKQNDCRNPKTVITIYYDSENNSKPYKVQEIRNCPNDDTGANKSSSHEYSVKEIKAKENIASKLGIGGYEWYFTSDFNINSCPKNVYFNRYDTRFVCFYNDDSEKEWCVQEINNSSDKNLSNYVVGDKKNITLGTYSNIKEGATCQEPIKLGGNSTTECFIKFEYKNGELVISKSAKNFDSTEQKLEIVEGDRFFCGTDPMGNSSYNKVVELTNGAAGHVDNSVIVNTRREFDLKYLQLWNESGSCPILDIPTEPTRTGSGEKYYNLLFEDASIEAIESGNSYLDIDSIVKLKEWNYDWNSWFGNKVEYNSCDGLLGDDLIGLINDILLYIRILVPVVLIGLGISDFVKAVISVNDDAMVKARNKFLKRLIMAVAVFIIPSLVSFLLETLDGIWAYLQNNTCSIWD